MDMKERFDALRFTDGELYEIREYYRKYHADEIYEISFEEFSEFSKSGNRISYERRYFERRHRINSTFMMLKIHGEEYLSELCSLLLAVCSERSWALPAHIGDINNPYEEIDLFAAETAMMLTEIVYLVGDILPRNLRERISSEVTNRVFIPFSQNSYTWETAEHNWSAVCAGAIGIAYLRATADALPLKRILKSMNSYLSGYRDDGVCLEGALYWSYGFGFYMYFAAALFETTGVDIIHTPKVKSAAEFYRNIQLTENVFISCSDAAPDIAIPSGLIGIIGEHFDLPPLQDALARTDDCGRWAHYIRSYLYPPVTIAAPPLQGEKIFEDSEWYINRKEKYAFFIKGGSNGEPHNHNDIASFIIADKNGQLLCDIGAGVYTRDYFNEEKRYNFLCAASFGHNVPIIDGHGQKPGAEYKCRKFTCGGDTARVDFGEAYGDGILAVREMRLSDNKITLSDRFEFDDKKPHIIYERFVTTIKPTATERGIKIGGLLLNKTGKITRESITGHGGEPLNIYLIDIEAENDFSMEFKFI